MNCQDTVFPPYSSPIPPEAYGEKRLFLSLNPGLMKKHVYLLFLAVIALAFNACQKEYSLEASKIAAEGTLRADGSGDCLPKTVAGTYEEGVELVGTENYLEIEVNVLTAGSYTISTDTVNGIYFIASGLFTNTGIQTVQLPGFGTPAVSGISNFVVQFDSTSCSIAVTTLPEGGGVPAVMTLDGDPNTCIDFTVEGSYITGTALNAENQVVIQVDVQSIGTYSISTTLSNGIRFSAAGTVSSTGPQSITLTGSGTPLVTGTTNIPVTVGSSTCSFSIEVVGPAVYAIDCGSAVVNGPYVEGVELDDSHTVVLQVNVTTAGGYNITGTVNGMTFSGAGDFAGTGTQTVTLQANGIPGTEGDYDIDLTGGSAACSVPITVEPPGTGVSGTWSLTLGGTTYTGIINGLEIDATTTPGFYTFYLYGENSSNDLFDLILADTDGTINGGEEYNFAAQTLTNAGAFQFIYSNSTAELYSAPDEPTSTIRATVTAHNTSTSPKTMSGTFTGKAMSDPGGQLLDVTNGQFTITYP